MQDNRYFNCISTVYLLLSLVAAFCIFFILMNNIVLAVLFHTAELVKKAILILKTIFDKGLEDWYTEFKKNVILELQGILSIKVLSKIEHNEVISVM